MIKLSSLAIFNIDDNKKWAPNEHIEDWINGCWKFSFAIKGIN